MEATKLSLGKIKTFLQCPLKYKLANIEQRPASAKSSAGLSLYQALHKALEYFHKQGLSPIPSVDMLLELLNRNWDASGYKDANEEKQYRGMAEDILRKFHQTFVEEKPEVKYFGLMVKFKTKQCFVSSRVDRVDLLPDGTYEIINYKTGKNIMEAPEMSRDAQAVVLYQGANAHKRFEGKVSKVSFYYLRPNRKVSVTPAAGDIKAVIRSIDQTARNITKLGKRRGVIEKSAERVVEMVDKMIPIKRVLLADINDPLALAEKGPLCSTCEYLEVCPGWPTKPWELTDESPEAYGERLRLSYSKMSSYKKCPRAWKKVYLDGLGLQSRPFFSFGTAMHEAFENFYDPNGKRKSSLKYLIRLWDEAFDTYQEGYQDKEEAQKYYQRGLEMIKKYYDQLVAGGKYKPAYSIEDYFEIPLGKNVVMTGYIDRIDRIDDENFEILDYKTEPTRRDQKALDEDDQLTIYFWACQTMFKLKIKQLSLLMLNFDEKMTTTRRAEDIPEVVAAIDAVAAEMKENIRRHQEEHEATEAECIYFPPRKNKYCKSCDYLETCSLKPDILEDKEIRTMEYD